MIINNLHKIMKTHNIEEMTQIEFNLFITLALRKPFGYLHDIVRNI